MQIIDKKTGKRIKGNDKKIDPSLKQSDPLKRNATKELEAEEYSPMDPPDAYEATVVTDVEYQHMHQLLQQYMDEHKVCLEKIDAFEKALVQFKENGFKLNDAINHAFHDFFQFFDNNIMDHNQREEKQLFPLLHLRLIASGESSGTSDSDEQYTPVDMMEDDHIKFIQLGTLAFNMLGLAARLSDQQSRMFVYDVAYDNGRELIEMLKLHIYREDNILFPLAHQLITTEEFDELTSKD